MAVGLSYIVSGASIAIGVILLVKLIVMLINRMKWVARFKDLPQDPSIPIFGHLLQYPGLNDAGLAFQRTKTNLFKRFSLAWLGHVPIVYCFHPDTVKIVLKSSEPKSPMYHLLTPWLGDGLLTSNGNKWSRNRRLLTPAFHFDILKGYLILKNTLCDDLLRKFEDASKSGQTLNVFDNVSMFTLDVILQSAMSYETGCQKEGENHPYIVSVNRIMTKIINRFLEPWFYSDLIYFLTPAGISFMRDCRLVHKVADDIISTRRKELESKQAGSADEAEGKKKKYQDFLDTLITARDEDGNGLTNKEIRDEVDTFLFEGHDTTASAISWTLYSIAEHEDVQRHMQDELDDLFADRESDCLLWEDLARLPYMTMVIKEGMRLHSPVPTLMRLLTKDTPIDDCTVPAGTSVCVSTYRVHHNALIWEDSMKFDPERFSPENSQKRDPFAFIPFSAGPRNCIGQNFAMDEIKVCLARILHRYTISLDPTHKVAKAENMVMKAQNDIKIYVKSRKQ